MEKPAVKTFAAVSDVAQAVLDSWTTIPGSVGKRPSFTSLCIIVAHSALETEFWKSMYNWNLGNAKSFAQSGDWTYYECGEDLSNASAHTFLTKYPDTAKLAPNQDLNSAVLNVIFSPKNPVCCFQAFDSLAEAMGKHLTMLSKNYPVAWQALLVGDVVGFCHGLHTEHYYTANEAMYTSGVQRCLKDVQMALAALVKFNPPPSSSSTPIGAPSASQAPVAPIQTSSPAASGSASTVPTEQNKSGRGPTKPSQQEIGATIIGFLVVLYLLIQHFFHSCF